MTPTLLTIAGFAIEVNPEYCEIAKARLKQQLLPLEATA